jgi:anti-anti-sigma regulatory factor
MAVKDNNPGLLSKMAKFVRNPTTNWSDLDAQEPEPDSGYSKQALKEMIERKRQNDFVRRREFDQLRKLRSRDPAARLDLAGRPSFFQSSIPSNSDERAVTLKKIDEIEAQMSKQWWKGKQAEPSGNGASFPMAGKAGNGVDSSPMSVGVGDERNTGFALTQPSGLPLDSEPQPSDFATTQMGAGGTGTVPAAAPVPPRNYEAAGAGFSTSKLFAVELSDEATDPDLEEAAIRFANGDDAGAEAGLLDALAGNNVHADSAEIWTAALFDFYRATGQQAQFDTIALDFAERFGRSAPAWFSMPEQLGLTNIAASQGGAVESLPAKAIWESPEVLDVAAMGALHQALANAPLPWYLGWHRLVSIQPDALNLLALLFSSWCAQQVRLRFGGAENLEKMLRTCTPSGDKEVSTSWWRLRMDALRIMRLQDEFELVALDYCVTYEVSPPSWQDARCEYVQEARGAGGMAGAERGDAFGVGGAGGDASQALTAPLGLESIPAVVVELAGDIVGDAADALQRLEAGRHGAERLVISCAKLIRVDFSAAGSILNWVANRENEGCHVQFREVHRLVAAFFNVIGINEHARVVLRAN